MAQIDALLRLLVEHGGDELILARGEVPRLRRRGAQLKLFLPRLSEELHRTMLGDLLTEARHEELAAGRTVQLEHEAEGLGSFAVELRGEGAQRARFAHSRRAAAPAAPAPPAPRRSRTRSAPEPGPPPPSERVPNDEGVPSAGADAAPAGMPTPTSEPSISESPPIRAQVEAEVGLPYALEVLVEHARELGASDLHLASEDPPVARVDGRLVRLGDVPGVEELLGELLSPEQHASVEAGHAIDRALQADGLRIRAHIYRCDRGLAGAFRLLRRRAPRLQQLEMPVPLDDLVQLPHGLVLAVGSTGSGKSTTLAALAQEILRQRGGLLVSLEDPIEYELVGGGAALVRQRELGSHAASFAEGLRAALREDPDVLLVGEMRDAASVQLALTAAETGHLVLSTLHSRSAAAAVDRIIDACPPGRHAQVRTQLAASLRAVIAQRLLPRASGRGRQVAVEILRGTRSVAALIRDGKTAQLESAIQTGGAQGMIPMQRCLRQLVASGRIASDQVVSRE